MCFQSVWWLLISVCVCARACIRAHVNQRHIRCVDLVQDKGLIYLQRYNLCLCSKHKRLCLKKIFFFWRHFTESVACCSCPESLQFVLTSVTVTLSFAHQSNCSRKVNLPRFSSTTSHIVRCIFQYSLCRSPVYFSYCISPQGWFKNMFPKPMFCFHSVLVFHICSWRSDQKIIRLL